MHRSRGIGQQLDAGIFCNLNQRIAHGFKFRKHRFAVSHSSRVREDPFNDAILSAEKNCIIFQGKRAYVAYVVLLCLLEEKHKTFDGFRTRNFKSIDIERHKRIS